MRELIRSEEWDSDVSEVMEYLLPRSRKAAGRLASRIDQGMLRVQANPKMGRARDELRPGLRSIVVGDYLLFYRVTDDAVEIVRFLHGSRDLRAAFG